MRVQEKFTKKLLLEGNDDQHVIWALCEKYNVHETFDVIDCGGINKLIEQIPVRFKQSGIEAIGIIIDADTDLTNRWDSIKSVLTDIGFELPANLPLTGLIISNRNNLKVGIWIMPNNNLNGMLEDFISFLVPHDDKLWPIVTLNLENIEKEQLNKYSLIHRSKAAIHSWLALQEDPGTPIGLSITKKYLTTDEETCSQLINWISKLFKT